MASSSAFSSPISDTEDQRRNLQNKVRSHEVAIAELSSLSSTRAVYHKNGSLFFRTTVKTAIASEQRQLDLVKAQLQKLNTPVNNLLGGE